MDHLNSKIFYLKKKVIFPHCGTDVAIKASPTADSLVAGEKIIAYPIRSILDILFYRNRIATLAEVISISREGENCTLGITGITRVRLKQIRSLDSAEYVISYDDTGELTAAQLDILRKKIQELVFIINVSESDRLINLLNYLVDAGQMTDFIANYFVLDFKNRYRLLYTPDIVKRSADVIDIMDRLIKKIKKHGIPRGDEKKYPEQ